MKITKMKTLKEKRILDKEVPRAYYLEEDVKQFIKEILEEIDKKNNWWVNLLKEKKYKNGSLKATRIYVITEELKSIKKIIKQKSGFEE